MASFTEDQFSRLLASLNNSPPAGGASSREAPTSSRNPFSPRRTSSRSRGRRPPSRENRVNRRQPRDFWHRAVAHLSAYTLRCRRSTLRYIRKNTRRSYHTFFDIDEVITSIHERYHRGRPPAEVHPTVAEIRGYLFGALRHQAK